MKARYKFRGMDKDTGGWWYGTLSRYLNTSELRIVDEQGYSHFVEQDTIGQATGIYDSDNDLIFEGDVIQVCADDDSTCALYIMIWQVERGMWVLESKDDKKHQWTVPEVIKVASLLVVGDVYTWQ